MKQLYFYSIGLDENVVYNTNNNSLHLFVDLHIH